MNPSGAGPQVYVRLVRQKLEVPVRRLPDGHDARLGILTGNPASDNTEAPIAIVCEFNRAISSETLKEAHRLAWNFCRSPLLVTVEPHLARAWSCYETPDPNPDAPFHIKPVEWMKLDGTQVTTPAIAALDWVQLTSGQFFVKHASRFSRNKRADKTLLENLSFVRQELTKAAPGETVRTVPEDIAHDLLARLIFIQFLCDRKDSRGNAALNESVLDNLHKNGTLSKRYRSLSDILDSKTDTYELFRWLDRKFNGDLFPGKGDSEEERETAWEREKWHVTGRHLKLLADFVSGKLEIKRGQMSLWPLYSFDTIPLEFVSSIYEEFVSNLEEERGEHYTPIHLVDFMLDKVLPWSGQEWDLKILDPACGSGIFLVKAFQRLAYRWRTANPGQEPSAAFFRGLLERNLFGVDIKLNAVRVASFSLYLAMCDEIDPRHYWTQVRFPRLRDVTLRHADFFQDDVRGFRTKEEAERYDLVIGNAPWGQQTLTEHARKWAADPEHLWDTSNEQSGTLFLPKAATLTKAGGRVCLIQPAGALLFNRNQPTINFRKELFLRYKTEEVVNLAVLRFDLFPNATSPACIITIVSQPSDGLPLAYWCPKQHYAGEGGLRIVIDAHDLNWVYPQEAAEDPWVWTALAWGGRRDHELVRRMKSDARRPPLESVIAEGAGWQSTNGFKRRISHGKPYTNRIGLRILEDHDLWNACPIVSDASRFPENTNPLFERPRDLELFQLPKLIMRLSWTVDQGRFKAILVESRSGADSHLLFSQSYYGVSAPDPTSLAALALVLNSAFAVYFFFLTGGRVSSYRPTLLKEDIEQIPMPFGSAITIHDLSEMGPQEIDEEVFEIYGLKEVERILVEDFYNITLQDFKGDENSPGRQPVIAGHSDRADVILTAYCEAFLNVLHAGFGKDKPISATIFQVNTPEPPPYCLIAFHLDWPEREPIVIETVDDQDFLDRLHSLDDRWKDTHTDEGSIFYQRVARVYQTLLVEQGKRIPTIYVIKPNLVRYWIRSAALRDADEVASDILVWTRSEKEELEQDAPYA